MERADLLQKQIDKLVDVIAGMQGRMAAEAALMNALLWAVNDELPSMGTKVRNVLQATATTYREGLVSDAQRECFDSNLAQLRSAVVFLS